MYINPINSWQNNGHQYSNQPKFNGLIIDKSALPIIKNMSGNDRLEFKQIKKRLSKTKFWDLKISGRGDKFQEFKFEFIDKKNPSILITDGIYPYNKIDNTIKIYSIIYGSENISSTNIIKILKYKTKNIADKLYDKYIKNLEIVKLKHFNLTPIESLKSKEIELDMLEKASKFGGNSDKSDFVNTEVTTKRNIGNDLSFRS